MFKSVAYTFLEGTNFIFYSSECDPQWFKLYNHLCNLLGFYSYEENTRKRFENCRKRIYWLQYNLATYEYDLTKAMNYLENVSENALKLL